MDPTAPDCARQIEARIAAMQADNCTLGHASMADFAALVYWWRKLLVAPEMKTVAEQVPDVIARARELGVGRSEPL